MISWASSGPPPNRFLGSLIKRPVSRLFAAAERPLGNRT